MSVHIAKENIFPLTVSGRVLGRFSQHELQEIRSAIDAALQDSFREVTPDFIIDIVCAEFCLKRDVLMSERRPAHIAWPRQCAMALIYFNLNLSTTEVGRLFGGKDHGTVLCAKTRYEARRSTSAEDRAKLQRIEAAIAAQRQRAAAKTANGDSAGNAAGIGMAHPDAT